MAQRLQPSDVTDDAFEMMKPDRPNPSTTDLPGPQWAQSPGSDPARWMSKLMSRQTGLVHAFTGAGENLSLTKGPDAHRSQHRRDALCAGLFRFRGSGGTVWYSRPWALGTASCETPRPGVPDRATQPGAPDEALRVSPDRPVTAGCLFTAQQIHGVQVIAVDEDLVARSSGAASHCAANADGLVTNCRGVALLALSADCPLVLVYDPVGGAFGMAHAGWRGTLGGIAGRLVDRLVSTYGSEPRQLVATISPSAGPCCYEVGADVVESATQQLHDADRFLLRRNAGMALDLWSANAAQLQQAGLSADAIERPGLCSICDGRFHSYRRAGPETGHSGLIAAMTD